jgi:hypothetical protein
MGCVACGQGGQAEDAGTGRAALQAGAAWCTEPSVAGEKTERRGFRAGLLTKEREGGGEEAPA